jgi:hypothetical protein
VNGIHEVRGSIPLISTQDTDEKKAAKAALFIFGLPSSSSAATQLPRPKEEGLPRELETAPDDCLVGYPESMKAIRVRIENGRISGDAPPGFPDGEVDLLPEGDGIIPHGLRTG